MKQLYAEYANCRGSGCLAELPKKFQVSPAEEKRITDHQVRATDAYFGN